MTFQEWCKANREEWSDLSLNDERVFDLIEKGILTGNYKAMVDKLWSLKLPPVMAQNHKRSLGKLLLAWMYEENI